MERKSDKQGSKRQPNRELWARDWRLQFTRQLQLKLRFTSRSSSVVQCLKERVTPTQLLFCALTKNSLFPVKQLNLPHTNSAMQCEMLVVVASPYSIWVCVCEWVRVVNTHCVVVLSSKPSLPNFLYDNDNECFFLWNCHKVYYLPLFMEAYCSQRGIPSSSPHHLIL